MIDDALMRALGFGAEDLEHNRAGKISPRQEYALRLRRMRLAQWGALAVLAVAFIASLLIFLGGRQESPILRITGVGLTLCNAAMTGMLLRQYLRLNNDIRQEQVMVVTGTLKRVIKPVTRRVWHYIIRVDEAEFVVPKETFDAFQHDAPYTLYRAPHSGTLLSAERGEGAA